MFLLSLTSAFPPYSFTQQECWEGMRDSPPALALKASSRSLLQKILLGNSGIERRHFCLPNPPELFSRDAGSLNQAFEQNAPSIAAQALTTAHDQAETRPADLDAIFISTCTGYLCPGLSSHVAEKTGMRRDAYLQDLAGLGCGAALPTLRSASHFLSAHPAATVAVIAVEICSAAFFMDDDAGVLISLCLFGDGASASIWSGRPPRHRPAYQAQSFRTAHYPEDRELIRFVNDGGKLKNKLHRSVPALAARAVADLHRASGENPGHILAHPGGRDVMDAIERELRCAPLTESREVLRQFGNLSSPSVMIALEKHLAGGQPSDRIWLTAFGAGFSCHSAQLVRV